MNESYKIDESEPDPEPVLSNMLSSDESDRIVSDDGSVDQEKMLQKRAYVILELIETEEAYVKDLAFVVNG